MTSPSHKDLLEIFDREQRRELEQPGFRRIVTERTVRHVAEGHPPPEHGYWVLWSKLDASNVEDTIHQEIAFFEALGRDFEWKLYDYDTPPDLRQRLIARGFEAEDAEAVMLLDLAEASEDLWKPPARTLIQLTDLSQFADLIIIEEDVWAQPFAERSAQLADEWRRAPDRLSIYIAYAEACRSVAPGSVSILARSLPASGAAQPGPLYRNQGYYTALLAVRAQEARRRGFRFLTIDASPMSRPIVEKHGFQLLTFAHACNWRVGRR